jgi:hypothetical protein
MFVNAAETCLTSFYRLLIYQWNYYGYYSNYLEGMNCFWKQGGGEPTDPEPEPEPEPTPPMDNDWDYYYKGKDNHLCRTSGSGGSGNEGSDYTRYRNRSLEWCMEKCTDESNCKGFEWNNNVCEIWKNYYDEYYQYSDGAKCFWKYPMDA